MKSTKQKQMHYLKKIGSILTCVSAVFIPQISHCQAAADCKQLHDGVFYSYPKNTNHVFSIERKGSYDKETDLTTGDSTIWNIVWNGSCESVSKYVSGNKKMSGDEMSFLSKHKLVFVIESITDSYYTFNGYADKVSKLPIQADTLWFHKKVTAPDNRLFVPAGNAANVRKLHFNDTSKYALLYIYRPDGHFKFSSSDYPVYFDNNLLCAAKNNSGFIFKILKEGSFEVAGKYANDETSLKVEMKFGNVYYIRTTMVWGISNKLNNFKLKMITMQPQAGKDEFETVDVDRIK